MEYEIEASCPLSPGSFLSLRAAAGEWVFLNGTQQACQTAFAILAGLKAPEGGEMKLAGADYSHLSEAQRAIFRRDHLGVVPFGGGMVEELTLFDQIALPLVLTGVPMGEIPGKIQAMTGPQLPLHSLFSTPGRSSVRRVRHAALLRALIHRPRVLVLGGLLEDLSPRDAAILAEALVALCPKNCATVYLGGGPAPVGIPWTRQISMQQEGKT